MCFLLLKYEKPKTAKKDIVCYKILKLDNTPFYQKLIIDGKEEPYEKGYVYYETNPFPKIKEPTTFNNIRIEEEAFHSYTNLNRAIANLNYPSSKIVKFIIPKGSKYLINFFHEEYVSNQIQMIEDVV